MDNEFEGPDVVVAGAGGGLVAALRAAQWGLSVLVIDSNESFSRGNNTSMSTAMIPAMGTRFQRAAGVADSPEKFLGDVAAKTGGNYSVAVARSLAEMSAELVEWLADDAGLDISLVTDFTYPGHSVFRCHTIPGRSGAAMLGGLLAAVRAHDLIDVYVPARLLDVNTSHGQVTSVTVETPDGEEEISTRAVILATNGFAANTSLVATHIPEIAGATYFGSEHSRGDALRIGSSLGAATAYLDAYQGHAGLAMPAASLATWATVMHGGFLVNVEGQRYGNEASGYSEYAAESLRHAAGESWIIIDQRIYDACLAFQDFLDVIAGNGVKWGEDPRALSASTGIDVHGLSSTVEAVSEIARGTTTDPFGRTNWSAPLEGRLAAIRVQPALFHTQGGLQVNDRAQVLTGGGQPIPGLYAAGGAASGISGHGASGYLAGNGLLPALGLSYIAATEIARWLKPA
ncbi:FAD-dependent oxidoreductase [Leucobacter aridicollis]|uniref:Fumarate reductase flavoprotein subunit n=1 Tax=Leucobacter aridicollis TaxID=283878 RepID=A0A852RG41_9MICO|nr:FAD-binding protein [Leucobacter aridicollis]MBL3682258.1 FAD-binding protein [Leucobacter aridicollis]NYD25672.1 fumarate reductase flavoprotein subunit [Leucobacter aridicollis]